ncbi:4-hydroxy-tetrahydrodipicolinate reductase [Paenibacillus sp.]|uniref:4-hydroxy-tetrahydrodipicolinate reductase n=1 Tax=Paenibacillus sp. TaxID=58172 RepID=UPI002D3A73CC|nr:4-hydroxy-tetrahydrodipicolinate reductase [Paenibacillus sp.]HZG85271.1 4-hydroxy-tetrahydrodipicolinate reductase [Paenibacillus sp.]
MNERNIRVAVAGAGGRMGREVVKMVLAESDFELAAAISPSSKGKDAGELVGLPACGVAVGSDLAEELLKLDVKPDVLVDFTTPQLAVPHTRIAIEHGVRPIMGTTGFTPDDIDKLDKLCRERGIGGLIAPNFSIGAILMMKFAQEAAKYFPHLEIIEYHGDQKLDAPSGTAVKTAELVAETRKKLKQGNPNEHETIPGARGGEFEGFRIHSVRLPGVFAQQEVVFGAFGQTLKIRHDSYDRAGYMAGVATAVRKVMHTTGLIYGFEHMMD